MARSRGVVLICLMAGLATICVLKAGLASLEAVKRNEFIFRKRERLVRRRVEVRARFVDRVKERAVVVVATACKSIWGDEDRRKR